ncbi:MAG: potassium/proton antiporter [Mycobacteriales bacterium]
MDHTGDLGLLLGCGLVLVAVLAVRLSSRTGVPALLVYLGIGVALGEAGLGVRFEDYDLTAQLGLVALAVILAEGGLTTHWAQLRPALPAAAVLSTVGVAVSVAVVSGVLVLVLGTSWRTALLLGGAVASTDAAAVFSVLRRLPLRTRVRSVLEAESGLNDAPTVVLVTLASSSSWSSTSAWEVAAKVLYELVVGLLVGLAVGWVGRSSLGRLALPSAGLYPLATVALVLLAFGAAGSLRASGFLAVYVAGLVIGSTRLPHRRAVMGFATSLALLAELGLFVLLGLLASPSRLLGAVPEAVLVGAAALLLARPLAVLVSTTPFRVPWREQVFLAWSGLRGAVPIVLATVPVSAGVPGGTDVLDAVFVLVVVYTLVQAPTLPWVGRRLGVVEDLEARDLEVESAPLEQVRADLLQVQVRPGSHLHGVYVDELRLPRGAVLSLLVRGGEGVVPSGSTRIEAGDQLLVVATTDSRAAAEERLRAVSKDGKLARWYTG